MLGRKQSVRNNEDWKNALDHIEETVPKKELDSLVKKTVKDIKEKCKGKKAAYAWSAGKDSLVLGEIISIQIHLFHPLSAVRGNKVFHCPSVSSSSHLCSGSLIRAERSSRCSPGSFCRKKSLPAKICKFLWCCVFDIFY